MNMLDEIMRVQDGAALRQAAGQVGLSEAQTATALASLVPALAAGLNRNVQDEGGLESLMAALATGNHRRYLDNPLSLSDPAARSEGNGILGHVLGSKEASREVAGLAAARTGLSADVLKRLLPIAATLLMSAMARRSGAAATGTPAMGGSISDMLGPLLDSNRDGSIADEVTGMLGRFFGGER